MGSANASSGINAGDGLEARRNRRALRLLFATGAIMLVLGLGWSVFFVLHGAPLVALTEVALAVLGIAVILAARHQHVRLASWMAFVGLFAFVCLFSLRLDPPTADVPRTTHLFLLVLAGAAHHVFRTERAALRYGCVFLFLAAFVVFAAMGDAPVSGFAIPDHVRRIGIWMNLLTVVASLLVVMHLQESDSVAHRALHRELRDALVAQRFVLFHQPQIDGEGRIVGAEALLRWDDPKRGLVPPGAFVQAAEETGFILPLGQWVLAEACRQLQLWQADPLLRDLRLSINVSALQLRQQDFALQVLDALARTEVPPDRLTLELTESVLVHDVEQAATTMRTLGDAGVRLSLDDFGTGYASLSSLRRLPFSELKIDRAFVGEVTRDAHAASITRNLLQLGHDLGVDVIAEGIEDEAQLEALQAQGCRLFQGYLFGRPMPVEAFERHVHAAAAPAFT